MVNRGALLLRYKEPAVVWINAADPSPTGLTITLDHVNRERTVYLISDAAGEGDASFDHWLKKNYAVLFETELQGWYTDPDLWPARRTYKLFHEWFAPELHTMIVDLVGGAIVDDEA